MTTVTLGDFVFARYEIPEHIPFGTSQRLNVHQLVGGTRVIDALGREPTAPSWSGHFIGEQALPRARYLKGLCEAGNSLPLTWDQLRYTVIIRSVECDFRLPWRIPYTITCEVVSDDTAPVTDLPEPSLAQITSDDLDTASGLADKLGNSWLTKAIKDVSDAIASVNDFATASLAQIRTVLQPIAVARGVAGDLLRQTSVTLANLGALSSLGGAAPSDISDFANRLSLTTSSAANAGLLANIDSALGRLSTNLTTAKAGSSTLLVGGADLFHVASENYGNPMAWTVLAQANGITDPTLSGISTLVIPPKPSPASDTGGILNA